MTRTATMAPAAPARPKRKFDQHKLPTSVALTTPAERMVIILAWADRTPDGEWESDHEFIPVLALQACVTADFCRPHRPDDYRRPSTIDAAEREGWGCECVGIEYDLLINSEDYGGLIGASQALAASNTAWRAFNAPWQPVDDEDHRALGTQAMDLESEAIENARRFEPAHAAPADGRPDLLGRKRG